jgi:hypothetical protein
MLTAASAYPNNVVVYSPQMSNSVARWLGDVGNFHPPTETEGVNMKCMRGSQIVALLFAFLLVSWPSGAQTRESNAAAALFEHFETVFHVTPDQLSGSRDTDYGSFVGIPFAYLLAGLGAVDTQIPATILASSEAVLVGDKDYRLPNGLGRVGSTFCYVVVLQRRGAFDLAKHFNKPTVAAVAGNPVWDWSAMLGEFGENDLRPSSLYATQLGQSYLLVSNNLDELQGLARRLTSDNNGSKVLPGIREWQDVSQHRFWGYRRYHHPESAVERAAGGTREIAPTAEALIVYTDSKERKGVLRLLSSSTEDQTARNINSTKMIPALKPSGVRAWQTTFPLSDANPFPNTSFGVLWLFGLGQVV